MKKLLLLGALLCTACLAAQARNRYFTHLTLDDGLSHNHIKAIVQDSYGSVSYTHLTLPTICSV